VAVIGKLLYGALFVVVLPLLLVAWARALDAQLPLPTVHSLPLGVAIASLGAAVMLAGWYALRVHGGGLPMNAFPPPRYAREGIYAWLAHPIYVGFCAIVLGTSVATGSFGGVFIVTPTAILACAGLVLGHERHDLLRRFGALTPPRLRLPADDDASVGWDDRLFFWLLVVVPWCVSYHAIATLGAAPDAVSTALSFEQRLPVLEWTEAVYASTYALVLLAPFLTRRRRELRTLSVQALLSMAIVFPLWLALPFIASPRPFVATTWLGRLLESERALDTAACAFPSFHVLWALIVAGALGSWVWVWALAIAASCVTTGMHTIADVAAAFVVYACVRRADAIWSMLRGWTERVANSWREWRIGPVRVINHGAWAAVGTFLALAIVSAFIGDRIAPLVIIWACTLVFAALTAQWLEGASGLSRPYGFWGGLLGATLGALCLRPVGVQPWVALGALSVASPFIQSMGRLRCLVQGCCHGSSAPPHVGIHYRHPRSRVSKVPELFDQPIHPTPLYSILWNVLVALVTVRLAVLHAPAHLLVGVFLILIGVGRFVEESYRGEPQTPVVAGLRTYQWIAIAAIALGAVMTAIGRGPPMPAMALSWRGAGIALLLAALNGAAFGVDFPESNRRFSRLA